MFRKNGMYDRRFNSKGIDVYSWRIIFLLAALGVVLYQLDSCGLIELDNNSDKEPKKEWGKYEFPN